MDCGAGSFWRCFSIPSSQGSNEGFPSAGCPQVLRQGLESQFSCKPAPGLLRQRNYLEQLPSEIGSIIVLEVLGSTMEVGA